MLPSDAAAAMTHCQIRSSSRNSWWQSSSGACGSTDAWREWSGHAHQLDRCHPCAVQEIARGNETVADWYGVSSLGSSPVEACQRRCKPSSPAQDRCASFEGAGHVDTLSVQPHEEALSRAGAAGARAGAVSASLMLKGGLLALMPLMVQSMDVAVVGQSTTSALRLMSLAAVQESL